MAVNRQFPTHGQLSLTLQPPLLIIEGEGPGNLEIVQQYQQEVQQYRERLVSAPWASLVRFHGLPLLPPQATELMVNIINYACTQNLVATAVDMADAESRSTSIQFWDSIYQQTPLPYRFFYNVEEAKHWLLRQVEAANRRAG